MSQSSPRSITILGSTGSIGCNTLDLISRDVSAYRLVALTGHRRVDLLVEQARRFQPELAVIAEDSLYPRLRDALAGTGIEAACGAAALCEAAQRPASWVMAAIVGAAGLAPTLEAVRRGAVIGLANKESLVCAGPLFKAEVARHGATLLPVDSEHNAIFQVFDADDPDGIEKIILTASGGPFRQWSLERMAKATPDEAVSHPNWTMGAKISVDSATMMNKGLEIIEAHHLFDMPPEHIDVLVHPQSVIHSCVAYRDGSLLAQMGTPDMRIPIAHCLAWPRRMETPVTRLDLADLGHLTFEKPDVKKFPALSLANECLQNGGAAPTILNAANEVAVALFLSGHIGFLEIISLVEQTVSALAFAPPKNLGDIHEIDILTREKAESLAQSTLKKVSTV